ncbi:MAG: hypothetical protein JSR37_07695 [Verrucomicrobia bacterium]|nr:hypothetical protein [Verrucomicrobiota bacterium]
MDIGKTFSEARARDQAIWRDEKAPFKARSEAMANANGRKFIIGSISGAFRVVGGVTGAALGLVGAAFCLVGLGLTSPLLLVKTAGAGKGMQALPFALCLQGLQSCGKYTLDKTKSVARGAIEILPFTGYALAKYDLQHPLAEKYNLKNHKITLNPENNTASKVDKLTK